MPNGQHHGITISPAWLTLGLTVLIQVIVIVVFITRMSSMQDEMSRDMAQAAAERVELAKEIRAMERNLNYLCNERRRDNQEAGRNASAAC